MKRQSFGITSNKTLRALLLLLTFFLLAGCKEDTDIRAPVQASLAVGGQPSTALIHIAKENGYFIDEGLDLKIVHFTSGKLALNEGLYEQGLDFAATADVPFVLQSFYDPELITIASIYTTDNVNRIVARKDSGIRQFKDVKGHTIATQENSAVHYFMHMMLETHRVPHEDVDIQFYKADELVQKLIVGDIDAFSMREPYISQAVIQMDGEVVILSEPGLYMQSELLVTTKAKHSELKEAESRLLSALLRAEDFAIKNKKEAIQIIAKAIGTDENGIRTIWNSFLLEISLDQTHLLQMERLARWITLEVEPDAEIPEFLYHIDSSSLRSLRPDVVSLVE